MSQATDDTHECPGPGCKRRVPYHMLMCRNDWARVPAELQRAVYATWRRGAGAGTAEHIAAMSAAISAITP